MSDDEREFAAPPAAGCKPTRIIRISAENAPANRSRPTMTAMPVLSSQPYRAYRPKPFTPAERGHVTVLFGGLNWRAERLLQGVLENMGHSAHILPTAGRPYG